jgi:hypothetical protein
MMAIVKASYTRTRQGAKESVRYITHRPGRDGVHVSRELWGPDGRIKRQMAYELIDRSDPGSVFFRFAISPDPQLEDGPRDLHLRSVTEKVMSALDQRTGHQVDWVASIHDNHTDHRHVHVVAVVKGRLEPDDLRFLTNQATVACVEQRVERDAARAASQQFEMARDEAEWDREL